MPRTADMFSVMEVHIESEVSSPVEARLGSTPAQQQTHLNLIRDLTRILGVDEKIGLNRGASIDALRFGPGESECRGCGACQGNCRQ